MELIAFESSLSLDLLDAASIHPEVVQAIMAGLFSAEPNLLVSNIVLPSTIYHISIYDLFCIRPACVRKDSIFGTLATNKVLGQTKLAIVIEFKQAHYSDRI
jgi:hypothetical protein